MRCAKCHDEFAPTKVWQRFCSLKCKNSWHRANDPERFRGYQRHWWTLNWAKGILLKAKYRASAGNLPFDLTVEDIKIPTRCPVDGLPIIDSRGKGKGPQARAATLDRVHPKLGYVKGNVNVISMKWNARKQDMSADDLRLLLKYIEGPTNDHFPEHCALSFGG